MLITIFGVVITDHAAFVVHAYLLAGDVLATIAVGAGIVWEHGSPETRRVADRLVIWGVVAETLCSVALFSFDEAISGSQQATIALQQSRIITLDREIAARDLNKDEQAAVAKVLRPFGPIPFDLCVAPGIEDKFLHEMEDMLASAGWVVRNFGGPQASQEQLTVPKGYDPGIGVCGTRHIEILVDRSHEAEFEKAAATLNGALNILGIDSSAFTMDVGPRMRAEIMHIQIGSRL